MCWGKEIIICLPITSKQLPVSYLFLLLIIQGFVRKMYWRLIDSGINSGRYNMAFDINLVENASDDEAVLRFYRWEPYCISLGANQKQEILLLSKAFADNIDIVTRPTGGRAILHAEELTYSVVFPLDYTIPVKKIYNDINNALAAGLMIYDENLISIETESVQPDFKNIYKETRGVVCFSTTAKSEIKINGKKLVGSAQRKRGKFVLQHGSILCGKFHRKIVDYLSIPDREKDEIKDELDKKTIELETILSEEINYEKLIKSLTAGFENYFQIKFVNSIDQKNEIMNS